MGVKHTDPHWKKNKPALISAPKFVIQSDSSRIFKPLGSARLACAQTPTLFSCSTESFALGLNFDSYLYYYFISHAFIMIPSIFTILDTLPIDSEWLLWAVRTMSSISRFVTTLPPTLSQSWVFWKHHSYVAYRLRAHVSLQHTQAHVY